MFIIRLKLIQKQRGCWNKRVPIKRSSALQPLTSGLMVTYTLATSPLLLAACNDLLPLGDPRMPLLKPLPAGMRRGEEEEEGEEGEEGEGGCKRGARLSPACHTPRCMTVPFCTSTPHTAACEA